MRQDSADGLHIVRQTAHQLTVRMLVKKTERQRLRMIEQIVAQAPHRLLRKPRDHDGLNRTRSPGCSVDPQHRGKRRHHCLHLAEAQQHIQRPAHQRRPSQPQTIFQDHQHKDADQSPAVRAQIGQQTAHRLFGILGLLNTRTLPTATGPRQSGTRRCRLAVATFCRATVALRWTRSARSASTGLCGSISLIHH